MKTTVNALHLASFSGNIGDAASHNGFYKTISDYTSLEMSCEKLEIREFYKNWGIRRFDENFVDLVNSKDLLIVGGGAFLSLHSMCKNTGTTFDIPLELLDKIKVPIYFNSIGINDYELIKNDNDTIYRFCRAMGVFTGRENILIGLRNDGARQTLDKYCSVKEKQIFEMPDTGYFVSPGDYIHYELKENSYNIAINLAADMADERFPKVEGGITKEEFIDSFAIFLEEILDQDEQINIVFVPHIYSDMEFNNSVIVKIKDYYRRTRITAAPYLTGSNGMALKNIDLYRKCDLAITMRNHAEICPIGMGIPTIGIPTLEDTVHFLDSVGHTSYVMVNERTYKDKLLKLYLEARNGRKDQEESRKQIVEKLNKRMKCASSRFEEWYMGTAKN